MAVRINKIIRELNISISSLNDTLKMLNYAEENLMPNTMISDELADAVRYWYRYGDMDLFDFAEKILNQNHLQKVQYGKVFTHLVQVSSAGNANAESSSNRDEQMPGQYDDNNPHFWIEEILVQQSGEQVSRMNVSAFTSADKSPLYSVLIGKNGSGKSTLLRELVEFFIDLHVYAEGSTSKQKRSQKSHTEIVGIKYWIDGQSCVVVKLNNEYRATVGGSRRSIHELRIPNVVACNFGTFDKFPVQSVSGYRVSRYDTPCYKYVGAHVSGSMVSSSAIIFRLLFSLNENMCDRQRDNVCAIMDFIGYDHKLSLKYSLVNKSQKQGSVKAIILQAVQKDKEYSNFSDSQKRVIADGLYDFYSDKKLEGKKQLSCSVNLNKSQSITKEELHHIYKLKQYELVNSITTSFYRKESDIEAEGMSSGELSMLATILGVSATVNSPHTLVLIDEPEISQHPNWQMSFIDNLDLALKGIACHIIIATHSHMLVSDLPMNRSHVTRFEKSADGRIILNRITECTYGWSAEEVLLKVFKTATDRNRYFGERVGKLLERMSRNDISNDSVEAELKELVEVSRHLSDIDPMKIILNTIVETYKS